MRNNLNGNSVVIETSTSQSTKPGPLRVLLVAARYIPYVGGLETHVFEVGRRLAVAGVEVTVLTTDVSGTLPTVEKFEGKPDASAGEIYCPSLGQYYPDVQDCASGWQRIIRPAQGG